MSVEWLDLSINNLFFDQFRPSSVQIWNGNCSSVNNSNSIILNTSATNAPVQTSAKTEERLALILDSIQDIKGKKIVRMDLRKLHDRPADFFFVCEGDSTTQVSSISNNVQKRMKQELGELPKTATGGRHANWICLDYFDVVVHVFYPETRAFYELEDLWSDAEITTYDA